jgi:Alpha/beta hydrolase family
MAGYVQLGRVRTWYEERGKGAPLVLLHGGLGDACDFAANIDALAARFRVFVPERRGHGHTADVDGPITYELMAQDTIAFLDVVVGGPAHLVGHGASALALRTSRAWRPPRSRCSTGDRSDRAVQEMLSTTSRSSISAIQTGTAGPTSRSAPATNEKGRCIMDWKLEVVQVPGSEVDRAKVFYTEKAGFNLDHDAWVSDEVRIVQMTPPGSACSIHLGTATTFRTV